MPNPETADAVEENAAADTAASNAETQPAGGSSPKTYTAEELDAKIKARIDKQNARHAGEMAALSKRIGELEERSAKAETERDALKKQKELADASARLTAEYGVPAGMLHGDDEAQMEESAKAAAAFKADILASAGTAPVIRDSGQPHTPPKSGLAAFDQFMKRNFQ